MFLQPSRWFNLRDLRWLKPGMRFKRWISLIVLGAWVAAWGLELVVGPAVFTSLWRAVYGAWSAVMGWLNLTSSGVSRLVGVVLVAIGLVALAIGIRRLLSSVTEVLFKGDRSQFLDYYLTQQQLKRGPKIVVIGGGTGLSTLLRGLKEYTSNITAIVTVADNGGSSGRLRRELGTLPPGDIRNCLVALADAEPLMQRLFQYRFGSEIPGLEGHSFGNIFIGTMSEITGDFETAVRESSRILAVKGQVLPSALQDVTLVAQYEDGTIIRGESQIPHVGKKVTQVTLEPAEIHPPQEALEALEQADLVVLGPGSLYTSVIPNILVPEIRRAVTTTKAPVIYVCNIMTQPGETDGYSANDHLEALSLHLGRGVVDYVAANESEFTPEILARYQAEGAGPVFLDRDQLASSGVQVLTSNFVSIDEHIRHSPAKLAGFLLNLVQ